MTALLRCRGSLSDIVRQFDAEPSEGVAWQPVMWPDEPVMVVRRHGDRRILEMLRWGLPQSRFIEEREAHRRRTLFSRELGRSAGIVDDPASLEPCLIVLESFAHPDGPAGGKTRSWIGLWDQPIVGWAGMCDAGHDGAPSCAGVIVASNALVARISATMPLLVDPGHYAAWLDGSGSAIGMATLVAAEDFYLENTGELWSTGAPTEDEG